MTAARHQERTSVSFLGRGRSRPLQLMIPIQHRVRADLPVDPAIAYQRPYIERLHFYLAPDPHRPDVKGQAVTTRLPLNQNHHRNGQSQQDQLAQQRAAHRGDVGHHHARPPDCVIRAVISAQSKKPTSMARAASWRRRGEPTRSPSSAERSRQTTSCDSRTSRLRRRASLPAGS